jgi:hypothetical protein
VQCVAPGPDPLFPVAIVMPITRDGRWRKYEDRKGQHGCDDRLRRTPSPNTHGLSPFEKMASRSEPSARHATEADGRRTKALCASVDVESRNEESDCHREIEMSLLNERYGLWEPRGKPVQCVLQPSAAAGRGEYVHRRAIQQQRAEVDASDGPGRRCPSPVGGSARLWGCFTCSTTNGSSTARPLSPERAASKVTK